MKITSAFKKQYFIIVLISLMLYSCSNTKKNDVFVNAAPNSIEYKNELAKKLRANPRELSYTFNKLVEKDGKDYLSVDFAGADFEATGLLLVQNWSKLEAIKNTKGLGYAGAELQGLEIKIEEDPSGANLIYKSLEEIVD